MYVDMRNGCYFKPLGNNTLGVLKLANKATNRKGMGEVGGGGNWDQAPPCWEPQRAHNLREMGRVAILFTHACSKKKNVQQCKSSLEIFLVHWKAQDTSVTV